MSPQHATFTYNQNHLQPAIYISVNEKDTQNHRSSYCLTSMSNCCGDPLINSFYMLHIKSNKHVKSQCQVYIKYIMSRLKLETVKIHMKGLLNFD